MLVSFPHQMNQPLSRYFSEFGGLQKPADKSHKRNRSYFIWDVGKQPDVVIEIVSDDEGGEDTTKMARYARLEIPYYAIYDPQHELSDEVLRFYVLRGRAMSR